MLLTLIVRTSFGQCSNGTITDPNPSYTNPANAGFLTNTFNWMSETFPIDKPDYQNFAPYTSTNPLFSPFFDNSDYLSAIAGSANSDFLPQNGWELVKQDFGYMYYNGSWNGKSLVSVPQYNKPIAYIMLYNKYQAKLRIMATTPVQNAAAQDKININISFIDPTSNSNYTDFNYSALFNHYNSLAFALDQPTPKANTSVSAMAHFPSSTSEFFYADFQLAYDPCTCFFESGLMISFANISSSDIYLSGKILATTQQISNVTSSSGALYGENNGDNYLSSVFTNADNYAVGLDQTYRNILSLKNSSQSQSLQNSINTVDKYFKVLNAGVGVLDPSAKVAFAALSGVLDFFSSSTPAPTVITGQIALSGQLITETARDGYDYLLATPGSLYSTSNPEYATADISGVLPNSPIYNDVPGLFALIKTPHINHYHQEASQAEWEDQNAVQYISTGPSACNDNIQNHPWVEEFQLQSNQFQYVLNPLVNASNTVIQAALEIDGMPQNHGTIVCNGYFGQTLKNESYFDNSGNITQNRTQFFPLSCIDNVITQETYNYADTYTNYQSRYTTDYKANIVFMIFYEFNRDVYGNVHRGVQIIKYPLTVDQVSSPLSSNSLFTQLANIANNLTIGNTTYTTPQDISSFGTITINGHLVNNSGGQITIFAEKGFNVTPGAVIDPGIKLEIGFIPDFCNGSPIPPVSSSDLTSFCQSTNYKANTASSAPETIKPFKNTSIVSSLGLYPNPTTSKSTLSYNLLKGSHVNITLSNVIGQNVLVVKDQYELLGNYNETIDLSKLQPGIYYVTFTTDDQKVSKKVIFIDE